MANLHPLWNPGSMPRMDFPRTGGVSRSCFRLAANTEMDAFSAFFVRSDLQTNPTVTWPACKLKTFKNKRLSQVITKQIADTQIHLTALCPVLPGQRIGKTNLDFTEARDSKWHWHQLGHMQVCASLPTDNHVSTHHSVFYRLDALHATQPTASKH